MSIKSRKLFAILVMAAMILTLLPMTALAASTNSALTKVPQVSVNTELTGTAAPKLLIKAKKDCALIPLF